MRLFIISLWCLCSFTSCVIAPPASSEVSPAVEQTPLISFPVRPELKEYTRKPVIEKKENDFLVSDEFVNNSVLLKKYDDRIQEWKKQNKVK